MSVCKHSAILTSLIESRGVCGAYEIDSDGFLLDAVDAGRKDPEAIAAEAAILQASSERIGKMLDLGNLSWSVLEYKKGKLILLRNDSKIWVIVTSPKVMLGEIIMKLSAAPT